VHESIITYFFSLFKHIKNHRGRTSVVFFYFTSVFSTVSTLYFRAIAKI